MPPQSSIRKRSPLSTGLCFKDAPAHDVRNECEPYPLLLSNSYDGVESMDLFSDSLATQTKHLEAVLSAQAALTKRQPNQKPTALFSPFISTEQADHLNRIIHAHKQIGLPDKIAQLWLCGVPLLMEASQLIVNPELSMAANFKLVRRIYNETCIRHQMEPMYFFDDNALDCMVVLMGVLPHSGSEHLISSIVQGERSILHEPVNAFAKNESMHCLHILLTSLWDAKHKRKLSDVELIEFAVKQMHFLYKYASRSPLFDYMNDELADVLALERFEREQYFIFFNDKNTGIFFDYAQKQFLALAHIRQLSQRRIRKFLKRDGRWLQPLSTQMDALAFRYVNQNNEAEM